MLVILTFTGYHVTCQNAKLYEIPSSLLKFLQTTEHQNIIVDLSSNFLSFLPCDFFEISIIITLVLSKNQIQTIPSCFSQSSIQILRLNENHIQFNQTMLFSSTKLHYLDLSNNRISYLPRTFLNHLRRLRTLILNSQMNLFQENSDQWIRSLTTRNQLTIIICDENFTLPLCLFDSLFQSKKLLSIEINPKIHCDCSFVYLPLEKIHFRHCQNEHQQEEEKCNSYSSHFDHGDSLIHMKAHKYRQICAKEYQICQNLQLNTNIQLTTNEPDRSLSKNQLESMLPIINSSINKSLTTSILTVTSLKKENITAGSIIPFILLLLIVTTVCLYIILSGRFVKMKNRGNFISLIMRKKQQRHTPKMTTSGMENFYLKEIEKKCHSNQFCYSLK